MSLTEIDQSFEKIRSEELREQARTASSEAETVIIEVDVPPHQIGAAAMPHYGSERIRPMIFPPTFDHTEIVQAAREALADVIGRSPGRYLASSHAFILDVTGEQLKQVAAIPEVRAIWPNTVRSR